MKRNIAIVAGGYSSESAVSLKSADGIYSFLDKEKYNVYIVLVMEKGWYVKLSGGEEIPVDKNTFGFVFGGESIRFDFAYVTIHGTPGENGLLQGYFEMLGIPYSSCGVLAGALTFNKFACNNYLRGFGIRVAPSIRLFPGETISEEEVEAQLGLPVFIKPNDGGSSFGTTKVKTREDILPAIRKAFSEGKEVIIERFVAGTEVTCGCYKIKGKEQVFPLTEVVTGNEFFDFDAKYNGQVDEITPARIPAKLTEQIQRQTLKVYDILGAKGLIRIDYIIPEDSEPIMLEVNTTPGMTTTSFIPQQVAAAGLSMRDVLTEIIENEYDIIFN
ncbi:MAG: D-alanine--D-alanine ligase [Tannerellaceae bacterium]|jgi:D-alanine-D-alanine ligase|nr:D-alanine--D-alanine ligase [Tannerellaceae bacterium]